MRIIMVSLTCGLLLEVGRSWEKRGEKAKTESSKSISYFRNHISSRRDTSHHKIFLEYKHAGNKLKHWSFIHHTKPHFCKTLIDDCVAFSVQQKKVNAT